MLRQAQASPDFNNYLAYIFSSSTPPQGAQCNEMEYNLARSSAGIMLKNNVRSEWKSIPEDSLRIIKVAVPMVLQDKSVQMRNFAGNIATEIIRKAGLLGWPELLPQLLDLISNTSGQTSNEAQEGAISALVKICEDNFKLLMREVNGQRPLNYVLPQLIAATKSPLPKVRVGALTAINVFTSRESQALLNSIDELLQHLFVLSGDENLEVRRQVCRAFVQLVEIRPDKLQPHISGLVDYILSQQKSEDEDLACEAAEFWLSVGEHDNLWQALSPYINKILPVLLECMVYSGEDIALLGGASDDEEEEDRAEDIKPAFSKKSHVRNVANGEGEDKNSSYDKLAGMDNDLEDGELDEDDDDGDENPDEKWTIRKCSAAALDVFARDFRGPVFEAILPYLSQNLKHDDWPHREAAVLALGAVAEGCMDVVTPHLPELIPYLITLLNDQEPVVRQITCWTLGRYSSWASHLPDQAQKDMFFVPMMEGILSKMLDRNKKVQEAGASAFANLEEQSGRALEPYCGPIIQQFVRCFGKYKDRNIYILYDCIQTLAERLGSFLARPELVNELMPALLNRYAQVPDQSREVFPMLECLSYVAIALGDAFSPYAQPIFLRCINLIHMNLEQSLAASGNGGVDSPDKDFLITSLDLLSAVVQALNGSKASELVQGSQQPFFELLGFCMEDPTDEVRQSAYALLGDCSSHVFDQLQPYLGTLMPILLKQLDLDSMLDEDIDGGFDVINNASWAAGEIAVRYQKNMQPWVPELSQRLIEIMTNPRVPKALCENAAIALGRLGLGNAEQLGPVLTTFAEDFLNTMSEVEPTEEKSTSFKGFTMVVAQNPQAIENVLPQFFVSIARYPDMDARSSVNNELHQSFQEVGRSSLCMTSTKHTDSTVTQILNTYKQIIPQFDAFIGQMQPKDQQTLRSTYAV